MLLELGADRLDLADDLLVGVVDLFDVVAVGEEVVEGVGGHEQRQHAGAAVFVAVGHAAGQDALLVLELGLLFVDLRLRLVELGLDLFDLGDGAVLLMAEGLEVGGELIELGLDGGEFFLGGGEGVDGCLRCAGGVCAGGKPEKYSRARGRECRCDLCSAGKRRGDVSRGTMGALRALGGV